MGCGCGKSSGSGAAGTHSRSVACAKCLAKHLSKAAVEYAEFLEDGSRLTELSLCVGNLACAEDHAAALGRRDFASRIRRARDTVFSRSESAGDELGVLAVSAVSSVMSEIRSSEDVSMEAGNASNE